MFLTRLPNRLDVQTGEAEAWAKSQGLAFFEVNALPPGRNVDAPFVHIAQRTAAAYESAVGSRFPSAAK